MPTPVNPVTPEVVTPAVTQPTPQPPPASDSYTVERFRSAQAKARAWGITMRRLPSGRVVPETASGSIGVEDYEDEVQAAEAADVKLTAARQLQQELQFGRLLDSLAAGTYYPRPRLVASTTATGQPTQVVEWEVVRTSNHGRVAGPYPGVMAALAEVARLVNTPPQTPGGP